MVQNKETRITKTKLPQWFKSLYSSNRKTKLVPPNLYHRRVQVAGKHHSAVLKVNKTALLFSSRLRKTGTPYKIPTLSVTKKC